MTSRTIHRSTWSLAIGALIAGLSGCGETADSRSSQKQPTNRMQEIMQRIGGDQPGSLSRELVTGSMSTPPDWASVEQIVRESIQLVKEMETLKPPRGDAESWKKEVGEYLAFLGEVESAVKTKSEVGLKKGVAHATGACQHCHFRHH